jgi:hypothetical protein
MPYVVSFANSIGAMFLGAEPSTQEHSQNGAKSPLPTDTIVETKTKSLSILSQGTYVCDQVLSIFPFCAQAFSLFFHFVPQPTQSQCPSKNLKVFNSQAAFLLGESYNFPFEQAVAATCPSSDILNNGVLQALFRHRFTLPFFRNSRIGQLSTCSTY